MTYILYDVGNPALMFILTIVNFFINT